jgi:hypothetical protein
LLEGDVQLQADCLRLGGQSEADVGRVQILLEPGDGVRVALFSGGTN